jgi:hypothetical protein
MVLLPIEQQRGTAGDRKSLGASQAEQGTQLCQFAAYTVWQAVDVRCEARQPAPLADAYRVSGVADIFGSAAGENGLRRVFKNSEELAFVAQHPIAFSVDCHNFQSDLGVFFFFKAECRTARLSSTRAAQRTMAPSAADAARSR